MHQSHVPVLHGSSLFPVRHIPLSVVRDTHGAYHRHAHDFVEIVLVAQGCGTHLRFGPDDERAHCYELIENDLFLLPLGWSHAYERHANFELLNLLFAPELLGLAAAHGVLAAFDVRRDMGDRNGLTYKLHLSPAERDALETCLHTITGELALRRYGFDLIVRAKLIEALALIGRAHAEQQALPTLAAASQTLATTAIQFMEAHLDEDLQLVDIAHALHLSPAYFCDRFKRATGLAPAKYLTRLRIEHAQQLLRTAPLPIGEVALHVGFSDASHFARVFRATVGMSPSAFQQCERISASSEMLL